MEKKDIVNWDYDPKLFFEKVKENGLPDIHEQNKSSAILWYNTIFSKPPADIDPKVLGASEPVEFGKKSAQLENQQNMLQKYIHSIHYLKPQMGNQDANVYRDDNEHTVSELISGGGRFGLEFESKDALQKYLAHTFGNPKFNDAQTLKSLIDLQESGISSDFTDSFGLEKRISSHKQEYDSKANMWREENTAFSKNCLRMDIPMGGIGNSITRVGSDSKVDKTIIGFNGNSTSNDEQYQLGTMMMRIDVDDNSGKARLMVGFEGTAPWRQNQFGASHGILGTVKNVGPRVAPLIFGKLPAERTLTGQSKGRTHGIFQNGGCGTNKATQIESRNVDGLIADSKEYVGNPDAIKNILTSTAAKDNKDSEKYTLIVNDKGQLFLENHEKNPLNSKQLKDLFPDSYFCDRMSAVDIIHENGTFIDTFQDSKMFSDSVKRLQKNPQLEFAIAKFCNSYDNNFLDIVRTPSLNDLAKKRGHMEYTEKSFTTNSDYITEDKTPPSSKNFSKNNDDSCTLFINKTSSGEYVLTIGESSVQFNNYKKLLEGIIQTNKGLLVKNLSVDNVHLDSFTKRRENNLKDFLVKNTIVSDKNQISCKHTRDSIIDKVSNAPPLKRFKGNESGKLK
jgi:hypothetical protein